MEAINGERESVRIWGYKERDEQKRKGKIFIKRNDFFPVVKVNAADES